MSDTLPPLTDGQREKLEALLDWAERRINELLQLAALDKDSIERLAAERDRYKEALGRIAKMDGTSLQLQAHAATALNPQEEPDE